MLYFTRSAGFEHSVVRRQDGQLSHSEKCLTEMGRLGGFDVECTKDGRIFDSALDRFDLIAFYTSGDLTGPSKDGGAPMTAAGKRNLLDAVAQGKPFVGFHACADSFHSAGPRNQNQDEVDPYIAMIGGEFIKHGAQQEASLVISSRFPGAASMAMGEGIAFHEEWYSFKNFAKDLHVILAQETSMMKGAEYSGPITPPLGPACTAAGESSTLRSAIGKKSGSIRSSRRLPWAASPGRWAKWISIFSRTSKRLRLKPAN